MPLGLWKSKWEIHREDMERYREEAKRRDEEWREEAKCHREEVREERAKSDARWVGLREECRDLRVSYDHELGETRRSTQEILARMEQNERNIEAALKMMGEQIVAMRKELHECTDAVKAQTQAIFKLVDRFEDPDGRPPV